MWRDPPRRPLSQRGFTLIELLVALSLLAVMSVLTYRAVSSTLDSEEHVRKISTQWLNMAVFFDQFERDTMQAIPRPIRDESGAERSALILLAEGGAGNQPAIEWTRLGEAFIQDEGSRRIGYRLRDGKLQYLQWAVLDRAPSTDMQPVTLLDEIQAFQMRCMTKDGRWVKSWPEAGGENELPRAIEVSVTLPNGARVVRLFVVGSA